MRDGRANRALRVALLLATLVAAVGCGACCPNTSAPFVVVRERTFRSDEYALPLAEPDAQALLAYLAAGGNRDSIGLDVVYPDAPTRYGPLLRRLTGGAVAPADLGQDEFAALFRGAPIRQIIDASRDRPPAGDPPYALTDGRFWWIFYPGSGSTISRVMVTVPVTRPPD